jgi:adenylate cyclase
MKLNLSNQNNLDISLGNDIIALIEKHYADTLTNKTELELRQLIKNNTHARNDISGEIKNKHVAILLSDLRGFTALSERYPANQMMAMLNRYFNQMNQVIAQYGGVIDKYMGDAIMVVFGLNEQSDDDLLLAIACAVEMQQRMDQVNTENEAAGLPNLFMGIGINSGEVSAGALGSDFHLEYSVIGDEVNLVSRVEAQTLRGQILLDEKTYLQVANTIEVSQPNPIQVKGKSQPLLLYEIYATQWPKQMQVPRREIRSCPRIEVDMPFHFQIVEGKTVLPEVHQGRIKDLGYSGMFALLPKTPEQIDEIKLSLSTSLMSTEINAFYGKVRMTRDRGDQFGCGVEFTTIDDDKLNEIKQFVDRLVVTDGY